MNWHPLISLMNSTAKSNTSDEPIVCQWLSAQRNSSCCCCW